MISYKIKKNLKLIVFKIIRKCLEISSKIIFTKFFYKLLTKIKYSEFFLERDDYKNEFISSHSDTEWIIEKLSKEGFCTINDFWSEEKCFNGKNDIDELYDLKNDPGEMTNLINVKKFDKVENELRKELIRLQKKYKYNPDRDWWLRKQTKK